MNLDFKRILSSVMALVMLCSSIALGNVSAVFADEGVGEMSITDVTVEESAPAEDTAATEETVTDIQDAVPAEDTVFSNVVESSEPLFINLGNPDEFIVGSDGGNINGNVTGLAAVTTKTWDAGSDAADDWVGVSGSAANYGRVVTFTDTTFAKNTPAFSITSGSTFTITAAEEATAKIYMVVDSNGKTGSLSVTGANGGTATVTGNVPARNNASAEAVSVKFSGADTYTVTYTGDASGELLQIVYTTVDDTPSPTTYTVSVNESPADGGTFTLTNGTVNCDDNNSSNTFPAGDVTLTVTPANGYEVESVKANNDVLTASNGTYSYTVSADSVITITYKETTVSSDVEITNVINISGLTAVDSITSPVTVANDYLRLFGADLLSTVSRDMSITAESDTYTLPSGYIYNGSSTYTYQNLINTKGSTRNDSDLTSYTLRTIQFTLSEAGTVVIGATNGGTAGAAGVNRNVVISSVDSNGKIQSTVATPIQFTTGKETGTAAVELAAGTYAIHSNTSSISLGFLGATVPFTAFDPIVETTTEATTSTVESSTEATTQKPVEQGQLYKFYVNADDATANGDNIADNATAIFTNAKTDSGSLSATANFTIEGKDYTLSKRTSNGSYSLTIVVPSGVTNASLYVYGNSSGSGTRTLTLSDGGSYSSTGSVTGTAGNLSTFTDLNAGTYTLTANGNWGYSLLALSANSGSDIETSTEATTEAATETTTQGEAVQYVYNFSNTNEQDTSFFTVGKTTIGSFGSTTYNSNTLTDSVKTDSNLNITFNGAGTLVLVTKYNSTTVGGATISVDGDIYTADSNGIITVPLTDGTHTITRNGKQATQHGLYYIKFTASGSSVEPEEGTLTVKIVGAPAGTTYKLLDGTTELTNNGTADTYTLQTNKTYTVQPVQVDHHTISVMYGSTDITNTDTFVFHSNTNELTITYTAEPQVQAKIYVSGQDQIPSINGESLSGTGVLQPDGSKLYTFTNYVNTAYTISAPSVPGYDLSITINGVETTNFVMSDGLVININYTEKQTISNVSWNFNELSSVSAGEVNDLGDNLTYVASSSDKLDSQNTNTFTTAIGTQSGTGIRPGGNASYTNRYFNYDLAPGATFTLYYVMVGNAAVATITDTNGNTLATGNTVSDKTTLGTVTYTNTTNDVVSLRAFSSNKPSFIGATVSGEIEPFTIAGTVYEDGTTNPIANATVTPDVAGVSAVTTDENGNYSFTGVTFTGAVRLTVTADNYLPTTIGSFVSSTTSADAYLKKVATYTISGKVVNESGTTLANAVVTLGSQKVITNSSGTFEFTGVTGAATLTVTLAGYKTVTYSFKGDGTETTTGLVATLTSPITVKFRLTGVDSTTAITVTSLDNTNNKGSFTKNITGQDYGLTFEAVPGERIKFSSKSTDIYEWHPIIDNVADTVGIHRGSIQFHAGSGVSDRYFIYTVPEDAEPDKIYGVEFIGTSGAGHTINPDAINEGYNLEQTNTIGYGQYGFGNDKIRVNAGKPTITNKDTIDQLAITYSARAHMQYAFANPTMNDFNNGFSHDQFNVIDLTGKPNVANQYGILDGDLTANEISNESFISFKPVIDDPTKTTVTVTIDASSTSGAPSYIIASTDGGTVDGAATKAITVSGKQSVELAVGYTYKITDKAGDKKQTYIKSIRIFDPNNVFATIADTDVTHMTSATEPNFYTEDMGSVDSLKNTAFGQTLGLTDAMNGMNVYRVVARIYVPKAEQAAPEQYLKTVNSVGFDVYKTSDYATIDDQTSTGNHYNVNQAVNTNYNDLKNTMEANKGEIIFDDIVNSAVMNLVAADDGGWKNASDDLHDNSAMMFGKVSSTSFEDLYVQTFIATNQSLTLIPYTDTETGKKYTICPMTSATNVAKTVGPTTTGA